MQISSAKSGVFSSVLRGRALTIEIFFFTALSAYNHVSVISLKKYMESQVEDLLMTAVGAWQTTLTAIAKAGAQAVPHLGDALTGKMGALAGNLTASVNQAEIADVQQRVETELAQWSESAAQASKDSAREVREMMIAMAEAAEAIGERDQRYSSQLSGLTTKLQSIARLEDLSSIRRSVVESATELKTAVEKMAEEGEQSISRMRAEVMDYRGKLEQSEKREAVDVLTGLASRREIEAKIEHRISWRRGFSLAILDLNGFKQINDVHGHVAGDDLLKQFAGEVRALFRPTDLVGRWGGDEFIVVVDSELTEATARLDRVRQWAFGEYTISTGKGTVQVVLNASIGIAAWDREESAVELMARADGRMYAEKKVTKIPRTGVA